jgi:hypothetical protein
LQHAYTTFAIKNKKEESQTWSCTFVIPALGRLRQEDREFEVSLTTKSCLKEKESKKKKKERE